MSIKLNQIGTVSHGTLRPEDLAPAFLEFGRSIKADIYGYDKDVDAIVNGTYEDDPNEVVAFLMDAIGAALPDFLYFGSIEGDGSDFGVFAVDGISEDLLGALLIVEMAAEGDSNDNEIAALRNALDIALRDLREGI
jgi:hypothetical protein